ncbi:hypothetical protein WKQ52_004860 [Escherichia coli]|nr:hypothetical protein [Escherichia coli]EYZ02779.1 hypothetical protein BX68_23315 [Escherichia coli O177:NM str. 2010C-4558]EKC4050307.1 hypothetical protein [Escherichia coli]EKE9848911.1 hypothetical protein [Escherichia coli]EKP9177350.1 hypothetical protein [Escherichia coli]
MSSPEQYLSSSEPASDTSLAVAPAQQNKSTIVRLRSFVCIADDAPEKRVNMSSPEYYSNVINNDENLLWQVFFARRKVNGDVT